ncbi:hypothetical protein [Gordonia alkanivorans]|uniref:hypothetical protein n=1 Tax=Gordonia alkanivorans TaxID=84096 RepID=UPI00244B3808|nr:hypothetical protein [Gordonia alkanivorans]MDH3006249.1 hypothetical protein [Gordonia alkanivorans]MDH3014006.1 hypothetical protein [Gordonia alkanivorans]MDH3042687.1 hypothetical protein [Gordonia alkanivorans]
MSDEPAADDHGSARASRPRARVPVDDDEVEIRRLHAAGLSQGQTARELGLDQPSLSRWSRRHGLIWGPPPAAGATQAERLRLRRQELAEQALSDALHIRKRLWDRITENVVTKDGVEQVTLDLPSARMVSDYASAIEKLTRVAEHAADAASTGTEDKRSMLTNLLDQVRAHHRGETSEGPAPAPKSEQARGRHE